MTRFIFLIFLFCVWPIVVLGQSIQFDALTVEDGLSQYDVSDILQDSEGFIWIGTYDGLNRFDGYEVEGFFHENENPSSLSSNRILSLFEDQNERVWIGTDGYGINYYSLKKDTFTRVETPDGYEIVNDINQDVDGNLLFGTSQGLFKVRSENSSEIEVEIVQSPLTGLNVKKITILKNGDIIFATDNGLWLNHEGNYELIEDSGSEYFNTVIQTNNGEIWAGGRSGLSQIIDKKKYSKYQVVSKNILSMVEGVNNDLWVSTFGGSLIQIELDDFKVQEIKTTEDSRIKSLTINPLKVKYKDRTNTLWLSNKNGVLYNNLDTQKFKHLSNEVAGHVRTLFASNNDLYYGLLAGGFFKYSFESKKSQKLNIPANAKAIKVDTLNGRIHLATSKGLYGRATGESNEYELVPIFNDTISDSSLIITSFCNDKFGNEYYGSFKGLIVKDEKGASWINDKFDNLSYLQNKRIISLKHDEYNNCIWAGTISSGLFKINIDQAGKIISAEVYNEQMSGSYHIPNNSIWCFLKDENHTLYVGTDTGLLRKEGDQNNFTSIKFSEILNKKILGIVEDQSSNLWLSNSKNLIRYNPNTGKTDIYNHYDGLMTNSLTEAIGKNSKGEIFIGSIEGINSLKTEDLRYNEFDADVSFTNLIVNNKKVRVDEGVNGEVLLEKRLNRTEQLHLNYKQNDFSIGFTTSNYANNNVAKYRYKLVDYDNDWQITSGKNRFAKYSNIPSGNYVLMVEATNPSGEWSGKIKEISLSVSPAPWLSWWAYMIYFLLIAGIISILFYFWRNKQRLRNQIAISQLKNQQEKEINEMKLIFFTDVAHEFKTPLSLIIGPLNDLIKGGNSQEHKKFCYNILSRSTDRMMTLVNQLLDFRKVSSGVNILGVSRNDLCGFVLEISKSFNWQAQTRNIDLRVISPDSYFCHFDKDIVEKVIYNLLSNAFKYTPDGGIIEIEIKPTWKNELEYFVILIKDSGKGIPQIDKKRIFQRHFHGKERSSSGIGLHLAATLIEAHRGEINVLNSSLGGTEFMITLPVSSKAFAEHEYISKEDIPDHTPSDYIPGEEVSIDVPENINDKREKILIVEDDYDLRKYLRNILITEYNVIEAVNGNDGIQKALHEIPDVTITDVMMPELDGIEMCKRMKENILLSHIPVLMLTAKTGDEFYQKGLEVGAWDYIAKPFNSAQLSQKVTNILDTRNNFRQLITSNNTNESPDEYVSHNRKFIDKLSAVIKEKMNDSDYSVQDLADDIGLSRMQLHRKIKALTGLSTTAFVNSIKIKVAIKLFDDGCDRVQEAMDAIGINSYAHFIKLFKKEMQMTPKQHIENLKHKTDLIKSN
ncbi:MAG: response regulator [Nonlabens sp.]